MVKPSHISVLSSEHNKDIRIFFLLSITFYSEPNPFTIICPLVVSELFDPSVSKDWKRIEENTLQNLNIETQCLYFMKTLQRETMQSPIEAFI